MTKFWPFFVLWWFLQFELVVHGIVAPGQTPGQKTIINFKGEALTFVTSPKVTFAQAEDACTKLPGGGYLAGFDDESDMDFLNYALNTAGIEGVPPFPSPGFYMFVGCLYTGPNDKNSLNGPGAFTWLKTGAEVDEDVSWAPGEPQKLNPSFLWDEDCCCAFNQQGRWGIGDIGCRAQLSYVCRRATAPLNG